MRPASPLAALLCLSLRAWGGETDALCSKAIATARDSYLADRPVDLAHLECASITGPAKAREVQLGRPSSVSQGDYASWLKETARSLGLDNQQESAAERLYLGRARSESGNGSAAASASPELAEARQRKVLAGARRVAGWFSNHSPEALGAPTDGGTALASLTAADYERLNRIPAAHGYSTLRTGSVPAPQSSAGSRSSLPALISVDVSAPRAPVRVRRAREQKGYSFHGKPADAVVYAARYDDGTDVEIVAPRERIRGWRGRLLRNRALNDGVIEAAQSATFFGDMVRRAAGLKGPGSQSYSVHQVADSARYLPRSSRKDIRQIVINPVQNPQDQYWARAYNMPGFRSYMTAGGAGIVTVYPSDDHLSLPGTEDMRMSLLHEAGHVFSQRRWGSPSARPVHAGWLHWRRAAARDAAWVSLYAQKSDNEDFAETFAVFHATQGTSRHGTYRAKVPMRFAIIGKAK